MAASSSIYPPSETSSDSTVTTSTSIPSSVPTPSLAPAVSPAVQVESKAEIKVNTIEKEKTPEIILLERASETFVRIKNNLEDVFGANNKYLEAIEKAARDREKKIETKVPPTILEKDKFAPEAQAIAANEFKRAMNKSSSSIVRALKKAPATGTYLIDPESKEKAPVRIKASVTEARSPGLFTKTFVNPYEQFEKDMPELFQSNRCIIT